jgi:hypothetical protein
MEFEAANTEATSQGELCCHQIIAVCGAIGEADAGELAAAGQLHAQLSKLLERIGHEAFATGLVDRWLERFDDQSLHSALRKGNGGCQAGWSSADNNGVVALRGRRERRIEIA